jgi:hypothetical protein
MLTHTQAVAIAHNLARIMPGADIKIVLEHAGNDALPEYVVRFKRIIRISSVVEWEHLVDALNPRMQGKLGA